MCMQNKFTHVLTFPIWKPAITNSKFSQKTIYHNNN